MEKTATAGPIGRLFWTHVHRTDAGASFRWSLALFVLLTLFPGIGSGGSVMAIGLFLFAVFYWIFDPDLRRFDDIERPIVLVFAAYFLIMLVFAVGHALADSNWEIKDVIVKNIMFLLFAPVFPVLRHFARPGWTQTSAAGLACGTVLAALIVMVLGFLSLEMHSRDDLRSAFSGNPLMLALGSMVSGLLCIHCLLFFKDARMRGLLLVGALAAFYALLTSGSRGALLSYGGVLVIYALVMGYRYFGFAYVARRGLLAAVALAVIGTLVVSADRELINRFELAVERLSNLDDAALKEKSISKRMLHYRAGLAVASDHPLVGTGRQNVMSAAMEKDPENADVMISTHLHNGYLTDFVASGVLGLLSLIAVLLVPLYALRNAQPFIFGAVLCVVAAYGLNGMVNLLFYHDISTLYYLSLIAIFTAMARLPNVDA